jgi:hypothetical protein
MLGLPITLDFLDDFSGFVVIVSWCIFYGFVETSEPPKHQLFNSFRNFMRSDCRRVIEICRQRQAITYIVHFIVCFGLE